MVGTRVGTMRQFGVILFLLGVISTGLKGCRAPSPEPPTLPSPTSSTPSPQASVAPQTTVTIYKANSQCDQYEPLQIQVPKEQAMEAAVGKVIEAQNNVDFKLAGYRVSVDPNGVATVDFRVAPHSTRQMVSLSSCEQFALFGSLTETLTKNSQWQVKSVKFTDRGEEIAF
jgi:hypothetical protein